jgi:hypothetical protein
VIEDDSEDDDSSRSVYIVFDNKLAHFILRHDLQNIELHLQTEEGTREANTAVFDDAIVEWFPLHLIYLPGELLLPASISPSLIHPVIFQLHHFQDIKVPLTTIQALLEANSHDLLTPNPDGELVVFNEMQTGAIPDIIHAIVEAQPSMLVMCLGNIREAWSLGNNLIYTMLDGKEKGEMSHKMFMKYLKIIMNKKGMPTSKERAGTLCLRICG